MRSEGHIIGPSTPPYVTWYVKDALLAKNKVWNNLKIVGFLNNFENALETAIALDDQILSDASEISSNYYDLLALSTRQVMGAIDFTMGKDRNENWNTSDVKGFLRNAGGIGSGGFADLSLSHD